MAKIYQEKILIKLSKLLKDQENFNEDDINIASQEIIEALSSIVEELVGPNTVVEILIEK
jgi:hypothetical protein